MAMTEGGGQVRVRKTGWCGITALGARLLRQA